MSARIATVGVAQDPYKRYWLLIVLGFAFMGLWVMLPMMERGVGSVHVSPPSASTDASAEQSLERAGSGIGAPGNSLTPGTAGDQGMIGSMLYQAPPEAAGAVAAAGAPVGGGAAAANLAQALKEIGKTKSGEGGWAEKAQRGFASPKLGGGGLSGLGGGGGSAPSHSAGGASAFGTRNADVTFGSAQGLGGGSAGSGQSAASEALRRSAAAANEAARSRSGDAAVGGLSNVFDGNARNNSIAGPGGAGGAAFEALDAAPANLKANDPEKFGTKELTAAPPSAPGEDQDEKQRAEMKQAAMMIGMMGLGMAGVSAPVMAVMMMMSQKMQADDAAARAEKTQARNNARLNSSPAMGALNAGGGK